MKQILVIIALLICSYLSVSAQKEIYFKNYKPEDIKVQSLQGVEVRFAVLPNGFIFGNNPNRDILNPSLYIGYFNEKRIADCWTLNSTIGFYNISAKSADWYLKTDSIFGNQVYAENFKNSFECKLAIGVEPRWYLNYRNRYQLDKAQLNSGLFLSFPLVFYTTILSTPEPLINKGWIPKYFYATTTFSPTLGYRRAVSHHWLLEGSVGLGVQVNFGITEYDANTYRLYFSSPYINQHCEIKAAYSFK